MDAPSDLSRRRLLQLSGTGLTAAVAGCFGDGNGNEGNETSPNGTTGPTDGGGNNESGSDVTTYDSVSELTLAGDVASEFRGFVLPGYTQPLDSAELIFQFRNFSETLSGSDNPVANQRDEIAGFFGTEPGTLQWGLGVGGQGEIPGFIYSGNFDVESVVETVTEDEALYRAGPREEYTIIDGEVNYAVSPTTIIEHGSLETFIQAERGEQQRLGEQDESVRLGLEVLPSGFANVMTRRPQLSDVDISTQTYLTYEGGSPKRRIRTLVFDEASNATLANARSVIEDDGFAIATVHQAEIAGRVILVDYDEDLTSE